MKIVEKFYTKGKNRLEFDELHQIRQAAGNNEAIYYFLVKDNGIVSIQVVLIEFDKVFVMDTI